MPRQWFLALALPALLLAACRRDASPGDAAAGAPAPAVAVAPVPEGPAVAEADVAAVLEQLTQALRKFSFEQRRLPASIDELVAAGYLAAKPAAPGGKHFVIDPKSARVVVGG